MKYHILLVAAVSFGQAALLSQVLPPREDIVSVMRLVNDYWIDNNPDPGNNQWARAAYFTGNTGFYEVYPKKGYLDYALLWSENNNWAINRGTSTRNADNHCVGQTYLYLYLMDEVLQDHKVSAIKESIYNMINSSESDDWWWIDALYMAMPVFTRLGVLYNDDKAFSRMYDLYAHTKYTRKLFNQTEGLWYRDESFAPPYTTPNGEDSYWSRGNGWVFGAHVRVLQLLPDTSRFRTEYTETFQQMAEALIQRQRDDGFWNVSLDDSLDYGGPESSGTSFFTYGLAWGINNGLLDSAVYYPYVVDAWKGLTSLAVHPNGFLGYVQNVGSNPSSSQPVTYNGTADFGVGAFLLAGSEVVKLAPGKMPTPSNFYVDSVIAKNKNTLYVYFSDTLDQSTAENSQNYLLDPPSSILGVSVGLNSNLAVLKVADLKPGIYTLSTHDIQNNAGEIAESGSYHFVYTGIASITASGFEDGSFNFPKNTIDYDLGTRWSAEGNGEWITYTLEDTSLISSVDIAFYRGNERQAYFTISVSLDGEVFEEIYQGTSSGITWELERFNIDSVRAKFLRITGNGNSFNLWNSFTEVHINTISPLPDLDTLYCNIGDLLPKFQPSVVKYELFVPSATDSVIVLASSGDANAIINGTGKIGLLKDTTIVPVTVSTLDSSSAKAYTITVIRQKSINLTNVMKHEKLSIYPNPSRDIFRIEMEGQFTYIVYDIFGTELIKGIGEENCLVGEYLTIGIYIIRVSKDSESIMQRVVKY